MNSQHLSRLVISLVFVGTLFSGSYSLAQRCRNCAHPGDGDGPDWQFLISTTNLDYCLTSELVLAVPPIRESGWTEEQSQYLWRIEKTDGQWRIFADSGLLLTADVECMTVSLLDRFPITDTLAPQLWTIDRTPLGIEIYVKKGDIKYWLGYHAGEVCLLTAQPRGHNAPPYQWCCERLKKVAK